MTSIVLTIKPTGMSALEARFDIADLAANPKLWRHLYGSLGVHLFHHHSSRFTLRLTNGVANEGPRGTVFLDWIYIEVVGIEGIAPALVTIPQAGHTRPTPHVLRFAAAGDCLPPRASYALDFMLGDADPRAIYDVMPYARKWGIGGLALPLPNNVPAKWKFGAGWLDRLRLGTSDGLGGLSDAPLGMWHYLYQAQAYQPGALGIDPIGGWHDDATTTVLGARLVMRRTFLDCLDAETGEPLPSNVVAQFEAGYDLARGCREGQTLPAFHVPMPGTQSWDDRTVPRAMNGGSCAYYQRIHGFSRDMDVNAPDDQHLQRVLAFLVAATDQYDDPCAEFDLNVVAQDVLYGSSNSVAAILAQSSGGKGHDWIGSRAWSWRLCALIQGEVDSSDIVEAIARAGARCAMPNGQVQRLRSSNQQSLGLSPDAWTKSAHVWTPIPMGVDITPTMEAVFAAHAFATAGDWRTASNIAASLLLPRRNWATAFLRVPSVVELNGGDLPKFVGVAHTNGAPFRNVTHEAGGRDYFEWSLPGLLALRAEVLGLPRESDVWIEAAMDMTTPGGLRAAKLDHIEPPSARQAQRERLLLSLLELDSMGWGQTAAMIQALRMRAARRAV